MGGKTSLAKALVTELASRGRAVRGIRMPGTTELGEEHLRPLLKSPVVYMTDEARMALFAADWIETNKTLVTPLLESGVDVVSDRHTLISGMVYEGTRIALDFGAPAFFSAPSVDQLIYIDAPAPVLVERASKRVDAAADKYDVALEAVKGAEALIAKYGVALEVVKKHKVVGSLFLNVASFSSAHWSPELIAKTIASGLPEEGNNSGNWPLPDVDLTSIIQLGSTSVVERSILSKRLGELAGQIHETGRAINDASKDMYPMRDRSH